MDKIGIACFSGTGNTEIVAELLKEKLSADLFGVEDILNEGKIADIQRYSTIGIGFNPPRIISDFVRKMERAEHKRVFLFVT
jgi:flavodoxin